MQSTLRKVNRAGFRPHVAIIMDGNGRWATARGWPRADGHLAGIEAVRRVVGAAPRLGVATLTLYAFSGDNWRRPPAEVATILGLLRNYLEKEAKRLADAGVRCTIIGRRDRLPAGLLAAMTAVEAATRDGRGLRLRLAIDYSSRTEIAAAAGRVRSVAPGREWIGARLAKSIEGDAGPVDLLIRTGGEKRLSDFLLWELAYAELVFTRTMWPQFGGLHLRRALTAFARRERRFGALAGAGVTAPAEIGR